MSMQPALNTSPVVTADSPKGLRALETFRAQYNKAQLDDEGAQLLNEHKDFAAYLAEGIRKFSTKGSVFPVYLEIETGSKSRDELLKELKAAKVEASKYAKDIMSKDAWKPGEKQVVKFARVKVSELGFTNPNKLPTTREIWARIQELGHSLCEPADGPAIRLSLKDQPRGDYFWTAMEQISDSDGSPLVFFVGRRDGGLRWLFDFWVHPVSQWVLDDEVVFRLRK